MKLLLYFLIILTFSSCSSNSLSNYKPSEKEQLANEITNRVSLQLKNSFDLKPFGSGGQAMNDIEMLALSFIYNKEIDIEDARELLINSVDIFVKAINEDERIHPYLSNYPFEPKNIEISIYLRKLDNSDITPGKLLIASSNNGILEYDIRDPKTDRLKSIYRESYEEALIRKPISWNSSTQKIIKKNINPAILDE